MPSKPAMARPGADTDETRAKNDHLANKKQAVGTYGFNVNPTSTGEKPQANYDQAVGTYGFNLNHTSTCEKCRTSVRTSCWAAGRRNTNMPSNDGHFQDLPNKSFQDLPAGEPKHS